MKKKKVSEAEVLLKKTEEHLQRIVIYLRAVAGVEVNIPADVSGNTYKDFLHIPLVQRAINAIASDIEENVLEEIKKYLGKTYWSW